MDQDLEVLFSNLAAPACRALGALNLQSLNQLAGYDAQTLANLHGIGPRALETIRGALQAAGLDLRPEG